MDSLGSAPLREKSSNEELRLVTVPVQTSHEKHILNLHNQSMSLHNVKKEREKKPIPVSKKRKLPIKPTVLSHMTKTGSKSSHLKGWNLHISALLLQILLKRLINSPKKLTIYLH